MDFKAILINLSYILQIVSIILFIYKIQTKPALNEICISKWVFYFGDCSAFVFLFGFRAELVEKITRKPYVILFASAIVVCYILCTAQCNWRIQYYQNKIIFKNSFGFKRIIQIDNIRFFSSSRKNGIIVNNDIKISWDPILINDLQDVNMYRFYNKLKNIQFVK